jgi:hypothetical protein
VRYIPATDVFVKHRQVVEEKGKVFHIFGEAPSSYLRVVIGIDGNAHFNVVIKKRGADVTACCLGRAVGSLRLNNGRSEEESNKKDAGRHHSPRFDNKSGSQDYWLSHLLVGRIHLCTLLR